MPDLEGLLTKTRIKKSRSNRKSPANENFEDINSNLINFSMNNEHKGGKKWVNLRNLGSSHANNFTQYSSGCISRSDLKFRLKSGKKCQKQVFRNTMKDLTRFVVPKSPMTGCTVQNEANFRINHSLTEDEYRNLMKSSVTNPMITPLMYTNRGKDDRLAQNYQCYSQMNDSHAMNNFDFHGNYSESGFSVNMMSNRGLSEQN